MEIALQEKVIQVPREVAQVPTEDRWFEVNPKNIDQKLIQKKWEELPGWEKYLQPGKTCQLIFEAFAKLKDNPEKYARKFCTMMPKKIWDSKNGAELQGLACELGDHNANWVEQALEWAQRICNGESWKAVCYDRDTANWYRLVVWKDGYVRTVGGSRFRICNLPAFYVSIYGMGTSCRFDDTVPLVVRYEE